MLSAITLLALIPAALALPRRATSPLAVNLQSPDLLDDVDGLKVTATVTNVGNKALTLVNAPDSVLSPWKTHTFDLKSGNVPATFAGYKVKYDPLRVATTTLAPGESTSVEHELAGAYDLTTSGAGKYSVATLHSSLTVVEDGALKSVPFDATGTTLSHSGVGKLVSSQALALAKTGKKAISAFISSGLTKRVTYQSCSADQKTGVDAGVAQAQKYATEAYQTIQADTSGDDRYTQWFGAYSSSRHSTVTSHYQKISQEGIDDFTFDCSCDEEGTFAFVNPDIFGTIHLCPAYWDAPTAGTDSKGGTLIHESSHFTDNGGTDDIVYGQEDAQSLAQSDPDQAIQNADNHEYYAEAGGA